MIRRDTERAHEYSKDIFKEIGIYDIQGLLKEGDEYKCGIESYQVDNFNDISFKHFDRKEELARFYFCKQLGVPYLIIIVSKLDRRYRVYSTSFENDDLKLKLDREMSSFAFIEWWR